MPIQSTPVTTQSTINLSDINIDTDLDMGSNNIKINGVPLNTLYGGKFYQYGKTVFNKNILETPIKIIEDTTVYTSGGTGSYTLKKTYSNLETLTGISDKYYKLTYQLDVKSSGTPTYAYGYIGKLGSVSDTGHSNTTSSYITYGSISTKLPNLFQPTDILYHGHRASGSSNCYTKDISVWLIETYDYIPSIINSTWLSSNGLNGIKRILLNTNDTIKINDSLDGIFSGTASIITEPYISTTGIYFDLKNDYQDITQIEITAGNPLIEFY